MRAPGRAASALISKDESDIIYGIRQKGRDSREVLRVNGVACEASVFSFRLYSSAAASACLLVLFAALVSAKGPDHVCFYIAEEYADGEHERE